MGRHEERRALCIVRTIEERLGHGRVVVRQLLDDIERFFALGVGNGLAAFFIILVECHGAFGIGVITMRRPTNQLITSALRRSGAGQVEVVRSIGRFVGNVGGAGCHVSRALVVRQRVRQGAVEQLQHGRAVALDVQLGDCTDRFTVPCNICTRILDVQIAINGDVLNPANSLGPIGIHSGPSRGVVPRGTIRIRHGVSQAVVQATCDIVAVMVECMGGSILVASRRPAVSTADDLASGLIELDERAVTGDDPALDLVSDAQRLVVQVQYQRTACFDFHAVLRARRTRIQHDAVAKILVERIRGVVRDILVTRDGLGSFIADIAGVAVAHDTMTSLVERTRVNRVAAARRLVYVFKATVATNQDVVHRERLGQRQPVGLQRYGADRHLVVARLHGDTLGEFGHRQARVHDRRVAANSPAAEHITIANEQALGNGVRGAAAVGGQRHVVAGLIVVQPTARRARKRGIGAFALVERRDGGNGRCPRAAVRVEVQLEGIGRVEQLQQGVAVAVDRGGRQAALAVRVVLEGGNGAAVKRHVLHVVRRVITAARSAVACGAPPTRCAGRIGGLGRNRYRICPSVGIAGVGNTSGFFGCSVVARCIDEVHGAVALDAVAHHMVGHLGGLEQEVQFERAIGGNRAGRLRAYGGGSQLCVFGHAAEAHELVAC